MQDEAAARQITELLPKQKTPEFERVAVEQAAFNSALEALQTRSIVTSILVAANCFIFACTVFAGAGLGRLSTGNADAGHAVSAFLGTGISHPALPASSGSSDGLRIVPTGRDRKSER